MKSTPVHMSVFIKTVGTGTSMAVGLRDDVLQVCKEWPLHVKTRQPAFHLPAKSPETSRRRCFRHLLSIAIDERQDVVHLVMGGGGFPDSLPAIRRRGGST